MRVCACVLQGALHDLVWWTVVRHSGAAAMSDGDAWEEHRSAGGGLPHRGLPHAL